MGVVAPNVTYTLDPATPNGQSGWYRSNVTVDWTVADGGAPTSNTGCADATYTTNGTFTTRCTATNIVGTSAAGPITIRRDATAPNVTLKGVANNASYLIGSAPTASCATSDATSGVATNASLAVTGGNGNVGQFTATCAGARDVAGNTASNVSAAYRVIYRWRGFLSPISNPPALNAVRAGNSAALRFSLGSSYGLGVVTGVQSRQINCSTRTVNGSYVAGRGSLAYSAGSGNYTYAWQTLKTWKGTCREFALTLKDGTVHKALFRIKP
jgi:hypothetical protein